MTWTKRTKPTTNWAKTQIEGIALTWEEAGERNLTWNDMTMCWSIITSTDWTKRIAVTTN